MPIGEGARPLPALLSQILVAFTVEFDNEFERRMSEAGYPGALLSLGVWANLMRFVNKDAVTVRDLAAKLLAPETRIKHQLGCLERWGFVLLQCGGERRDGWGSGRGIRPDSTVSLTPGGIAACKIWPPLFGAIERRWEKRFGKDDFTRLRRALEDVADKLDFELPHGLPGGWEKAEKFPPRIASRGVSLPLPTLLSWLLLTFRIEFDRESIAPLELCANILRVLTEQPIREAQISHLTGASAETSGIGWQVKSYVVVEPDTATSRGKVIRLSPGGLAAQQTYALLILAIEERWETRFGKVEIGTLRESLLGLFEKHNEDGPLLSQGLVPARSTVRAGHLSPALGRRDAGPAAKQRMRDLVAQTQAFISDPAGALPHYPLWDMNRGFGP